MCSFGTTYLDAHDRLEQHGLGFLRRVLERHGAGNLERHFRRVDIVVRAVVQLDAHVVDRIAREHAARERFLDAHVDRLDEFLRNRSALRLVLEDVTRARLAGIQMDLHVAVLAAAARLLRVLHFAVGRARERFLVRDLRLADGRLDAELALQPVDDDLEVQLAHAGDDDLTGLLVGLHVERRVFGHQLLKADAELFLVGLRLRLDRERDDRLREVHRLEDDRAASRRTACRRSRRSSSRRPRRYRPRRLP